MRSDFEVVPAFLAPMRLVLRPAVAQRLTCAGTRYLSSPSGSSRAQSIDLTPAAVTESNAVPGRSLLQSAPEIAKQLVARGTLNSADEVQFANLTVPRAELLMRVVEARTRHISFCLDDVHGLHNLAAVVRSCDAWGILDVHCVMGDERGGKDVRDGIREHKRFYSGGSELTLYEMMDKDSVKRVSKGAHKVSIVRKSIPNVSPLGTATLTKFH
jgi:hypothetical protein